MRCIKKITELLEQMKTVIFFVCVSGGNYLDSGDLNISSFKYNDATSAKQKHCVCACVRCLSLVSQRSFDLSVPEVGLALWKA